MLLQFVVSVFMPWPLTAFGFWLWICLWLLCLYLCLTHLSVLTMIFRRTLKKPFMLSAWIKDFLNLYTLSHTCWYSLFSPSTCLSTSCLFFYCFQCIRYTYKWVSLLQKKPINAAIIGGPSKLKQSWVPIGLFNRPMKVEKSRNCSPCRTLNHSSQHYMHFMSPIVVSVRGPSAEQSRT